MTNEESWTEVITSEGSRRNALSDLFKKKDLILLFVKRDFAKEFKQTILGPIWFVVQPLFQTIILLFVFGKIGKMGPTGIPMVSFYLGGAMMWGIFSENLLKTSETFRTNAGIFGKVYFPRLVMPVSMLLTNYLKLGVQFVIFLIIYFVELSASDSIQPNFSILLVPFYFIFCSLAGTGFGLILCSLTTKYWDLRFMIQFAMQLLMFLSAVITPLSMLEPGWMKMIIQLNPASPFIEAFRYAFLGKAGGSLDLGLIAYGCSVSIAVLMLGVYTFRRVERTFIDSI